MEFGIDKIHIPNYQSFTVKKVSQEKACPPRVHAHKNYELNYVLSGTGKRIVGNHISSFQQEDLVLLGPDLPHSWEMFHENPLSPPISIVVHFHEAILQTHFWDIPELQDIRQLFSTAHRGTWFEGSSIQKEKIKSCMKKLLILEGIDQYIELLKIFSLLTKIRQTTHLSIPMSQPIAFSKDISRINLVYEYVFRNINRGIRLEAAAALLNMEAPSFCRYFKKKTNLTFMQYVKSVRIGIAARMLAETEKQVTHICYESGYNNLANFNHQFRSVMQMTPSEYRKNFR